MAGFREQAMTVTHSAPAPGHAADAGAGISGRLDGRGNRYWAIDVSQMPPLYQELYERIFAQRLELWGAGAHGTVCRAQGSIVYGGPDELMRALDPTAAARRHILAGDERWVAGLERTWRAAAERLEAQADALWDALLGGRVLPERVRSLLDGKVALNAIGMDSIMPPVPEGRQWLAPHVDESLLDDVVDGCYTPDSGSVAFDELELECWLLARSSPPAEPIPDTARARFIQRGLFYLYGALDTRRKTDHFELVPRQMSARYQRAALGEPGLEAAINEVRDRPWRRRYHRQWARQTLEHAPAAGSAQVLLLHRFVGSARDYDEEKRRINMKLWRALFALADGLGVCLMGPDGTAAGLLAALARQQGQLVIDPVFRIDCRERR